MKCTYGTINRGLCDEKFVKLEKQPKIEEIFHMIKEKKMFVAYSKKNPAIEWAKTETKNNKLFSKNGYLF